MSHHVHHQYISQRMPMHERRPLFSLQALSLLVVPLPWTAPRLLAVQLAVPAAILEGGV